MHRGRSNAAENANYSNSDAPENSPANFSRRISNKKLRTMLSSKTKGPGEKGAPGIIPKFRLRNWPILSGTILAIFGSRILGQNPAAPSSPGPFGLLVICVAKEFASEREWFCE